MERHGGSMHLVRPDRIVRTGVLQPIVGYQPQNDVIAVTSEFANGPTSGMQLSGYLGEPKFVTWFRTLGARIKAAIAAPRAGMMMLTDTTPATQAVVQQTAPILAAGPVAPQYMSSPAMAPQFYAMADMANFLAMRGASPMRGEMFSTRRWNTYYNAG